ncbi:hypothetical protein LSTR_LSTR015334 [Laodelphax striatellus]|uniref:Tetratricopeptide repeat protein 39B n=1 Tax=Laodelphax striatellus TaxID=195883 RepID=A0A482WUG3_LAOST|nr:hypothetical protein LSTR_LSTR015334 [Laodelphax striatellus]
MEEEEDLDDEFEDAYETIPRPSEMDLETAMQEARTAVHLFFNNRFDEAWDMLKPWVGSSMYHTIGNSVFCFMEAVLTFDPASIQKTSEALKQSVALCNFFRKKRNAINSIGKYVKKTNYDNYTPEEIHAELCYAEALLLKALLTFIEDETLPKSFFESSYKILICCFRECQIILNSKQWVNDSYKLHFESGVRMGIGAFNLMISLLPSRIIKLLEFIGFSGSKDTGIEELVTCYESRHGLRHILSVMTLLTYNLIVVYVLSRSEGDLEFCDEILKEQMKLFPDGAWFLFFKGRLEFMKGNIVESNNWYVKSWKSQQVWPQFHHLCFWDLMWTNIVRQEWNEALFYANKLMTESKWSRSIYGYQKVCLMLMIKTDLSIADHQEIDSIMSNIPKWRQRIAGKSLPMEKFCAKKSERYFAQNKNLVLPCFELLLVWNLFKVVGKKWELCDALYREIEESIRKLDAEAEGPLDADNRALLLLLKGACLNQMGKPYLAEEALKGVSALAKKIKEDNYLVPYSLVELAMVYQQQNDLERAIHLLEDTRKNYTGYSLESRLHFQIHSSLMELNKGKKISSEKMCKPNNQPSTSQF